MTAEDIAFWLSRLGHTKRQKVAALRDLLRHAKGDEMSDEDRAICLDALHALGTTYIAAKVGAYKTHHSSRKFFAAGVVDTTDEDAHI